MTNTTRSPKAGPAPESGTIDRFARIALERQETAKAGLIEPGPPILTERVLPSDTSDPAAAFHPRAVIDTPEKLRRELARQRRHHAKFLRMLAPPLEDTRYRLALTTFDWRAATDDDLADFAGTKNQVQGKQLSCHGDWERVCIPHYGGPLGRATAYYRTSFEVTEAMRAMGALFVCFKGVDYIAHVFVNGELLGSHEGMFAPFEFDCTAVARTGNNTLLVKVVNDAIHMGNDWGPDKDLYEGDKICGAEGPGYDDPEVGWHVTPPGMGITGPVCIEARHPIFVSDIFVRPVLEEHRAEAWIEVTSCARLRQDVSVSLSVFGQNFAKTVCVDRECPIHAPLKETSPQPSPTRGGSDCPPSVSEGARGRLRVGPGVNYLRVSIDIGQPRLWDTDTPWLYQAQVTVRDAATRSLLDVASRQFGMRSFRMEEECRGALRSAPLRGEEENEPKGRMYLNGREVRLRGANVSGSIQQCVMRGDLDRLADDILLAKIAHLNFLRIIQRPVQSEVYDMCDRLGIMTQTDLPLFGVLRRNQFCEAVRQAEEMERLIRSHPCNILVSYINEPFPGAMGKPHRHLLRDELEGFFRAANEAVKLANPDRVVKAVDGDYDPPGPGQPDNHCYCIWYNGHGVDLGKLHKGYWQQVKPGWLYACGEFGAEGLDTVDLMRNYCPPHWLPQTKEDEAQWTPGRIPDQTQTGRFHYLWFDTPHTLRDWVAASRDHQAWGLRLMVEAFRRDSRMNSFAIYYLIDSWPTGWMKSIIACDREPKPAYFACREALTPLMTSIRADRTAFRAGEAMSFECWVVNDTHDIPANAHLRYQLEQDGEVIFAQRNPARIEPCTSTFQGFLRIPAPAVERRTHAVVRLGLLDERGRVLHDTAVGIDVFPRSVGRSSRRVYVVGSEDGKAARLGKELGLQPVFGGAIRSDDIILTDAGTVFRRRYDGIMKAVSSGATLVMLEIPEGDHEIAGDQIVVLACGMGARHFVSRDTGHPLVAGFEPTDFRFWYDPDEDRPSPLLRTTFDAHGWTPILTAGNGGWSGEWRPMLAAAEKIIGKGRVRICQVSLAGRTVNPVAESFALRMIGAAEPYSTLSVLRDNCPEAASKIMTEDPASKFRTSRWSQVTPLQCGLLSIAPGLPFWRPATHERMFEG